MLTKSIIFDRITVTRLFTLEIAEEIVISENGSEISRALNRRVLHPGDDVSSEESPIKEIAALVWTPDVLEAHKRMAES